eukprot:TRINITY_DN663_c0_g1_i1.p1 TRINITY_DN663_c0_g1~~TRINITY_DN663_c0_g1_i1.p1  ORF type:complete len:104 (+),score=59.72 TRINITY_DN663_c0_g1_i1:14-325(+)
MIRRPPRSTQSRSSAASDVYKRQESDELINLPAYQSQKQIIPNKFYQRRGATFIDIKYEPKKIDDIDQFSFEQMKKKIEKIRLNEKRRFKSYLTSLNSVSSMQ